MTAPQVSPGPQQGNGPAIVSPDGGGASPRMEREARRRAREDDETCQYLVNVLWTLRAHLRGDTPITAGSTT